MSPAERAPRLSLMNLRLPGVVLALGLALTLVVVVFSVRDIRRAERLRFDQLEARVVAAVEGRFQAAVDALESGKKLVEANPSFPSATWANHVQSVWPYVNKGVVGLG